MRILFALAAIVFLSCGIATAQQFSSSTGDLVLWKDGISIPISTHSDQTGVKAVQKALEVGPGTYRVKRPDIVIVVKPGASVAYPACGTGRCDGGTPEQMAEDMARRKHYQNDATVAWLAIPGNEAKMRWPSQAMRDANLATWKAMPLP